MDFKRRCLFLLFVIALVSMIHLLQERETLASHAFVVNLRALMTEHEPVAKSNSLRQTNHSSSNNHVKQPQSESQVKKNATSIAQGVEGPAVTTVLQPSTSTKKLSSTSMLRSSSSHQPNNKEEKKPNQKKNAASDLSVVVKKIGSQTAEESSSSGSQQQHTPLTTTKENKDDSAAKSLSSSKASNTSLEEKSAQKKQENQSQPTKETNAEIVKTPSVKKEEGIKKKPDPKTEETAALCLVQKDELPFLDEWADYHLAIGFTDIYIYDNMDNSTEMLNWHAVKRNKDPRLHIIPYPGDKVQAKVYKHCAWLVKQQNHTWVSNLDADEFLVLKKHTNVLDFAREYVPEGHLALSWEIFGTSGRKTYEKGYPVTMRFQCVHNYRNYFTKSLMRVRDIDPISHIRSPHVFPVRQGQVRVDTDGTLAAGSKHEGPRDVAVINHYYYRSHEEYLGKRKRGDVYFGDRPEQEKMIQNAYQGKDAQGKPLPDGFVQDDTAWQTLKRLVPSYQQYEQNPPKEPGMCSSAVPQEYLKHTTENVALCAMHKDDTWFINEWADYQLALGFSDIYIFDNSHKSWQLMKWSNERRKDPHIHVFDFAQENPQLPAYQACVKKAKQRNNTWAMFMDVDEFLVLKKPNMTSILDFAQEYGKESHVGINWQVYGTAGRTKYESAPVTYRFPCQIEPPQQASSNSSIPNMNHYIRSLVRLDKINAKQIDNPYIFSGAVTVDTNGTRIQGPQHDGPRDVAVVNHYYYRSQEEFGWKLTGHGVANETVQQVVTQGLDPSTGKAIPTGSVRDTAAWDFLKRASPGYKKFESKRLQEKVTVC